MNKSKILGIALIIVSFVLVVYFGYNNYQERKQLKNDKFELTNRINQLQQTIAKNNQIIAANEQSKRELENQSISRQEQINEQLKDNDCANQFVLCISLVACTTERKVYVNQPMPVNLLSGCMPNLPPKKMTFGDSVSYNEHLLNVIEMCNQDKRGIRKINM